MPSTPEDAAASVAALPTTLRALLAEAPGAARPRLEAFLVRASGSLEALGILDLSAYESDELGTADLGAWEAIAPLMGTTVAAMSGFLEAVRDDMFDEPSPGATDTEVSLAGAFAEIQGIAGELEQIMLGLGGAMRDPQVMGDRWKLLAHLQSFRGRFREGIGQMVYLAASALGEVRKDEVVPHYLQEIAAAVRLRRAVAHLADLVHEQEQLSHLSATERAEHVLDSLSTFRQRKAWNALRPDDKRTFLEVVRGLRTAGADAGDLDWALRELEVFLDTLQGVNRREALRLHDRGALARITRLLEELRLLAGAGAESEAAQVLANVHSAARTLRGLDRGIDAWLSSMESVDTDLLTGEEIARLAAELEVALATVDLES